MASNFPTGLDTSPGDPNASDFLNSPPHHTQHGFANDAIVAIQAYLGIIGSAVVSSITYLLTNTASVNPGHKHTIAAINIGTVTQHAALIGGTSGNIASVVPGNAGTVLTSNGTSSDPSWQQPTIPGFTGDGSDGPANLDGTNTYSFLTKVGNIYTMTRDAYFTDLAISAAVTLKTGSYKTFGTGVFSGSGTVDNSGNAGGTGGTGTGAPGAAIAAGTLTGSAAGGTGQQGTGSAGGNISANGLGSSGGSGGAGAGNSTTFSGGAGGTVSAYISRLVLGFHAQTMFDSSSTAFAPYQPSAGGGGGGGATASSNRSGGGGGSGGGFVYISFATITFTGTISANGGAGGGGGSNGDTGVGGGGGGGGGGVIVLLYFSYANSATLQVNGGVAGPAGTSSGGGGHTSTAGTVGPIGTIYQFVI